MNESIRDLPTIPGVGKSIAQDLTDSGIRSVNDLKNQDPERLYHKLCAMRGRHIDRCVLYVFRCAIYFASEKQHDPHLLEWWNWKDQKSRKSKKTNRTLKMRQKAAAPLSCYYQNQ